MKSQNNWEEGERKFNENERHTSNEWTKRRRKKMDEKSRLCDKETHTVGLRTIIKGNKDHGRMKKDKRPDKRHGMKKTRGKGIEKMEGRRGDGILQNFKRKVNGKNL